MRVRVLLVDDNEEFLGAARNFLAMWPELEIVGTASSGESALSALPSLAPDLVLLDWTMPGMSGPEAAKRLKAQPNAPRVVLLTLREGPLYRSSAQDAGADGFINKSEWTVELLPTIHRLFASD